MVTTPHLAITLVEQSQAQKEITVNQALVRLEALLNTGAISKVIAAPPGSPVNGDLYIIASSPTGDWAGHADEISYFDDIWRFIEPDEGVTLWVNDENLHYTYDGSAWVLSSNPTEFQNLNMLGINTVADTTNKLAIASSAILLNHNGAGVQAKFNKNSSSDASSLLFQTGTSGRAEFGTVGDDNFTVKVSSDGSSWLESIKCMAATGRVAFKSIATAISAAGTTQGTATAIIKTINVVSTVAAAQGVVLPTPEAGEIIMIANQGANTLTVYPASGHQINTLGANTGQGLAANTRRLYFAATSSQWYTI